MAGGKRGGWEERDWEEKKEGKLPPGCKINKFIKEKLKKEFYALI